MGNTCSHRGRTRAAGRVKDGSGKTKSPVCGSPDDIVPIEGVTRVLAVALDYQGYDATKDVGLNPLSCTPDARRFIKMAESAGAEEIIFLTDQQELENDGWANHENVAGWIQEMGARSQPGDCFVFFYAGHGTETPDQWWGGDEADGNDEELCLTEEDGTYCPLVDDDISALLVDCFDPDVKVLFVTDCCQSGTVVDLDSQEFGGLEVAHLAAVKDYQYAQDLGDGGAFTSSLMETLETMVGDGVEKASVADVYCACANKYSDRFEDQDFSYQQSRNFQALTFPWPLFPGPDFNVNTALDE